MSTIPVREALQLLQSEGLVVNVPHVGATVAPISRESVLEVFTITGGARDRGHARGRRARDAAGDRSGSPSSSPTWTRRSQPERTSSGPT